MFIDAHTHLQMDEFQNELKNIIDKCIKNKVFDIANIGYSVCSSKQILTLQLDKRINNYAFAGIHPHYVKKESLQELNKILQTNKFTGIGEIGLDKYWYKDEKQIELQKKLFKQQLKIAEKMQLPVMLHVRQAYKEVFDILKAFNINNICFHSFSGTEEELEYIVNNKYFFSINGIITFKNSSLKHIIKKEYFDYMLLETDAPYLTPFPYRGKRNKPYYIIHIYDFISNYFSITMNNLTDIVKNNFFNFINK